MVIFLLGLKDKDNSSSMVLRWLKNLVINSRLTNKRFVFKKKRKLGNGVLL